MAMAEEPQMLALEILAAVVISLSLPTAWQQAALVLKHVNVQREVGSPGYEPETSLEPLMTLSRLSQMMMCL